MIRRPDGGFGEIGMGSGRVRGGFGDPIRDPRAAGGDGLSAVGAGFEPASGVNRYPHSKRAH